MMKPAAGVFGVYISFGRKICVRSRAAKVGIPESVCHRSAYSSCMAILRRLGLWKSGPPYGRNQCGFRLITMARGFVVLRGWERRENSNFREIEMANIMTEAVSTPEVT